MNKISFSMTVILAVGVVASCEKPRKVEAFGEPFSVTVDGRGMVPTFELAMVVSKDASPSPLVQPTTTLLVHALKKCAGADDLKEHKVVAEIAIATTGESTVKVSPSPHPYEACLGEAIKASKVEWPVLPDAAVTRIELRLAGDRRGL